MRGMEIQTGLSVSPSDFFFFNVPGIPLPRGVDSEVVN